MFDGGKDIAGNKLINEGLCDGIQSVLYDLFDTERESLDHEYFMDRIRQTLRSLRELSCFITSVVVDNLAAQNLAIKELLLEEEFSYLLHFRCTCHSSERYDGKTEE